MLTLEIYRKNNNNKPNGCGLVLSDPANSIELNQQQQQQQRPQPHSPVNHSRSTSVAVAVGRAPAVVPNQTLAAGSIAVAVSRRAVENASPAGFASAVCNGSIGGHVRYPSNSLAPVAPLGAGVTSTNAPLKVAFNKSIGGGVLV